MKKLSYILFIFLLTTSVHAYEWEVGIGASYANISGINAYKATGKQIEQDTNNLTVPSIFVSKKIGSKFNLLFRYTNYGDIVSNGTSSDANIFNESGNFLTVITPFRIVEQMSESSFTLNYTLIENNKWKLQAGPSLSIASTKANFLVNTSSGGAIGNTSDLRRIRQFKETDYTLGVETNLSFQISERTNLNLNFRYINPSEKNIYLIGASMSFNF